jgi:aerobic carbon-monoxide dehydrogenase medium subunit
VKPAPFRYVDPRHLDEALAALAEHGDDAAILAGGQSLLPLMNLRLAQPEVVVDINRIPDLDRIEVGSDEVRIGAMARASTVERHDELRSVLPVVAEALRQVAHPQIRNRTTIGGTVAHADPAAELPALLAALDGTVTVRSTQSERTVGWEEFFLGSLTTAREPQEMVVSVGIPVRPGLHATFLEVARRRGDFALVGACVALSVDDGLVGEARVAVFGVGGAPVRVRAAEEVLVGRPVDDRALADVRRTVARALDPIEDVHASAEYRRHVGGVVVARAVRSLWEKVAA